MVLSGIQNCEVYLDDIVIYSMTWEDHIRTLEALFKRLNEDSLTLNLAKCEFARAVITYLGKLVGQGQVRPVEAKVSAIIEFPSPTNKRELCCFFWNGWVLPRVLQKFCLHSFPSNRPFEFRTQVCVEP